MKVISFISPKGGVGKTTLALHLATSAERDNKKVAILDLDPQGSACFWADQWEESQRYNLLVDSLQPSRLEKMVTKLQNNYDLCIIDTAGFDDLSLRTASKLSHITLMPIKAGLFDLHSTMSKYDLITGEIYAVLNAVQPNTNIIQETKKSLEEANINYLCTISQRQDFVKSIIEGMTAYEYNKSSKASQEQEMLYKLVSDIIF